MLVLIFGILIAFILIICYVSPNTGERVWKDIVLTSNAKTSRMLKMKLTIATKKLKSPLLSPKSSKKLRSFINRLEHDIEKLKVDSEQVCEVRIEINTDEGASKQTTKQE